MRKKKTSWEGRTELRRALENACLPPDQRPEISEPVYFFHFSSTLRIAGDGLNFDEISQTLGLTPTHTHRKRGRHKQDMWAYKVPLDRQRPLEEHIMALWDVIRPHIRYLQDMKQKFKVDVFCGYRSNSATAGFQVSHSCLGLFSELEIPFGVSVVIS
jgi:hypothetical protein